MFIFKQFFLLIKKKKTSKTRFQYTCATLRKSTLHSRARLTSDSLTNIEEDTILFVGHLKFLRQFHFLAQSVQRTRAHTHTTLGRYAISQRTTLSKIAITKTTVKYCWQQQR